MARRKKGRDLSGWIVVDKPVGPTSTDVVNRLRRAFDARKAGHAGTLDPLASGVLAIAFGEATKTVAHVTDADKLYRFTVRLGIETDTDDTEGKPVAQSDLRPEDAAIAAALAPFRGHIMQVPPQYSAVKVAGERAYDLAREGEGLELAARPLFVERLELVARPDADHAELEMVCGKGGYVRSIARDLGRALGCFGHVSALRRLRAGPFEIAQAVPLNRIEGAEPEARDAMMLPIAAGLAGLPEVRATPEGAARLSHGNPGQVIGPSLPYGSPAWASWHGAAIAVGHVMGGELHPSRVFRGDAAG